MKLILVALVLLGACGPTQLGRRAGDRDGGTHCTRIPRDSDGDGISDLDEDAYDTPPRDTDGDATPDFLDLDSDGDGIPDAIEGRTRTPCDAPYDTDGDGVPDYRDLDSDSATDSTVPDAEEAGADPLHPADANDDGRPDYMDIDNDGDTIPDVVELTPPGQAVNVTTYAEAPDTDGDGVPDVFDTDSDGDTILDQHEGAVDTDGDGVPNFRDLDSDDDCLPDALEAGDADSSTAPIDTDDDGAPDFEDRDADNEGLVDNLEDPNCNGVVDPCESDRLNPDTDGDGVSDLIERQACEVKTPEQQAALMCQCDASNPGASPLTHGDFVFVSDFQKTPSPTTETLDLSTDVSQADVIFALDSTGSMQGCLTNLANGLASIVPQVRAQVPNVAFGVVDFKDFGDSYVVRYAERNHTVATAAGLSAVQGQLSALRASGGGDGPEAGWEALYAIAGGPRIQIGGYDSQLPLGAIPGGETGGNLGGAGFRAGSVPIVVTVSDAEWHDAPNSSSGGENGLNKYGGGANGVPSRAQAVAQLGALDAHVIGLAALGGAQTGDPKARALALAQDTGAVVSPDAFGGACGAGQCCTGQGGAGEAPVGGLCRLGYSVNGSNGSGVSEAVANGIIALANGLRFDIHVEAVDVDPDTIDRFVGALVPNVSGTGAAAVCIVLDLATLLDNYSGPQATPGADSVPDTFPQITGGQRICFDVIPKVNVAVPNTDQPQLFRAQLQVKGVGNGVTVNLGYPRDVFFLVPPVIINGPIG